MNDIMPESEVKIKVSICEECKGFVTAAVEHKMDIKDKNRFMKDVLKYNLSVKSMPLADYREAKLNYCTCKKAKHP